MFNLSPLHFVQFFSEVIQLSQIILHYEHEN